jgi:hypothetical protein
VNCRGVSNTTTTPSTTIHCVQLSRSKNAAGLTELLGTGTEVPSSRMCGFLSVSNHLVFSLKIAHGPKPSKPDHAAPTGHTAQNTRTFDRISGPDPNEQTSTRTINPRWGLYNHADQSQTNNQTIPQHSFRSEQNFGNSPPDGHRGRTNTLRGD